MFNYISLKLEQWLDQTPTEVSISQRFLAYIIDFFLGALLTNLPVALIWLFYTKDVDGVKSATVVNIYYEISKNASYIAFILAFFASIFYYIIIPLKNEGQTPGKKFAKTKMVKIDGEKVGIKELLLRQFIGIIIIQGLFYNISTIMRWMFSLVTNINITGVGLYFSIITSIISLVMLVTSKSRRMLHDYIAKTKVINIRVGK